MKSESKGETGISDQPAVTSDEARDSLESGGDALTFEQALEKLQQTVKALEGGELSLENSLRQFEDGVRLSRICQQHLSVAEQRVELLMRASADGTIETQPFGSNRG